MENTTQGKKPAEWFKMLKEPYRSEAIANINSKCINLYYKSIRDALSYTFTWFDTPQGDKQWVIIYDSLEAGETTYLEPELIGNTDKLKPEQMELSNYKHLDWVIIQTKESKWLIKIDRITDEDIHDLLDYNITEGRSYNNELPLGIYEIQSIRPATNDEVLKYFPDEKLEIVSLINEVNNTQVTEQQNQIESEKVETDWKAKFEEANRLYALESVKVANIEAKFDALADKYSKLEAYNDEITETYNEIQHKSDVCTYKNADLLIRINELLQQNNQEKVYIHYNSKHEKWQQADTLELALQQSEDNKNIYEAVKIGVKKSVLVNENS